VVFGQDVGVALQRPVGIVPGDEDRPATVDGLARRDIDARRGDPMSTARALPLEKEEYSADRRS